MQSRQYEEMRIGKLICNVGKYSTHRCKPVDTYIQCKMCIIIFAKHYIPNGYIYLQTFCNTKWTCMWSIHIEKKETNLTDLSHVQGFLSICNLCLVLHFLRKQLRCNILFELLMTIVIYWCIGIAITQFWAIKFHLFLKPFNVTQTGRIICRPLQMIPDLRIRQHPSIHPSTNHTLVSGFSCLNGTS